ncbi:hypothetical protein IWZ00DRAFT_510928 [Phyllosticta capitalensis]
MRLLCAFPLILLVCCRGSINGRSTTPRLGGRTTDSQQRAGRQKHHRSLHLVSFSLRYRLNRLWWVREEEQRQENGRFNAGKQRVTASQKPESRTSLLHDDECSFSTVERFQARQRSESRARARASTATRKVDLGVVTRQVSVRSANHLPLCCSSKVTVSL